MSTTTGLSQIWDSPYVACSQSRPTCPNMVISTLFASKSGNLGKIFQKNSVSHFIVLNFFFQVAKKIHQNKKTLATLGWNCFQN
jgi:hypothetical protein